MSMLVMLYVACAFVTWCMFSVLMLSSWCSLSCPHLTCVPNFVVSCLVCRPDLLGNRQPEVTLCLYIYARIRSVCDRLRIAVFLTLMVMYLWPVRSFVFLLCLFRRCSFAPSLALSFFFFLFLSLLHLSQSIASVKRANQPSSMA